jgi:glucuronate isomerase
MDGLLRALRDPAELSLLGGLTDVSIDSLSRLYEAIGRRLDQFDELGCRLSDVGLEDIPEPPEAGELSATFDRLRSGKAVSEDEHRNLAAAVLLRLGGEYARRGWTMQLHIGAQRETSSRLRRVAGPAGGFACIGNAADIERLARFLDALESDAGLPRTILYNLNPTDSVPFATISGSFAEDGVAAKVQLGPAWWYNDHLGGIKAQITAIADYSLLSNSVGMTTDSRSPLSYIRHEYFRRVFCNLVAEWVDADRLPRDEGFLRRLVANVCYNNANQTLRGEKEGERDE